MEIIKRNKSFILTSFLIFGLCCGAVLFFSAKAMDSGLAGDTKPVKSIIIEPQQFSASQEYGGFVRGIDQAVLMTKINGRITKIAKKEGEFVKKGEVIVLLSADEITAQLQGAQQSIEAFEKTLDDTEKYYDQKVDEAKDNNASKEEVQSAKRLRDLQVRAAKTELVNAQGSLGIAQSYAKETSVRAPFNGVITRVFQEVGQVAGPTTPICEIAGQAELSMEVFVSRKVMAQLVKGEKVTAFCGDERKSCEGIIESFSPASEMNAQKSLVRILFKKENPELFLGQYAVVNFPTSDDGKNVIVIPEESIIARYDEKFVYIMEGESAKERQVHLGQLQDGKAEVLSGINPGEHLIVQGMHEIRNNDKVKIYD